MSDFERVIADALELFGWRWVHFRAARTVRGWRTPFAGNKGFVDFVAVRGDRLLFIEIKGDTGYPDPEQRAWRDALIAAGAEWVCWRPKDWDTVKHLLAPEGVGIV